MNSVSEMNQKLAQFKQDSDDFNLDQEELERFLPLAERFLSESTQTFTKNDVRILKLRAALLESSGADIGTLSTVIDRKMQEVISKDKHPQYFQEKFWELCKTFSSTIHDEYDEKQPLLVKDMEKLIGLIEEEKLKNMLDSNFEFKTFHDNHYQILQRLSKENLSRLCTRFSLSRLGVIAALGKEGDRKWEELKTKDEIDLLFEIYDTLGQKDNERLFSEMGVFLDKLRFLNHHSNLPIFEALYDVCSKCTLSSVEELIKIWNKLINEHYPILQKLSKEDLSRLKTRFSSPGLNVIRALGQKEDNKWTELKTKEEIDHLFDIYDLLGQKDNERLFSEMGRRFFELQVLYERSSEDVRNALNAECKKCTLVDVDQLIKIWNNLK